MCTCVDNVIVTNTRAMMSDCASDSDEEPTPTPASERLKQSVLKFSSATSNSDTATNNLSASTSGVNHLSWGDDGLNQASASSK